MTSTAPAGSIFNRAAQTLRHDEYDFVILGGGLLGVACAFFLRQFAPARRVLLVEAGGIPSEGGATHVAPALHHHFQPAPDDRARARWLTGWLRETGETAAAPHGARLYSPVGFLAAASDVAAPGSAPLDFGAWRATEPEPRWRNVQSLFGFTDDTPILFDPAGGYGSAEALVLHLGHAAVRAGLDLMLNTRAAFAGSRGGGGASELRLERLEVDNRMQVEIVREDRVKAGAVIVACGAAGPGLIAAGLGVTAPFASCFVQYPRFENDRALHRDARGTADFPVVAAHGFAIRPHGDGALLVPMDPSPSLAGDPPDYVPVGGELHGVTVGLRPELLRRVVAALEVLPALSRSSLNLGKTPAQVRGTREIIVPPGGSPEIWRAPGSDVWLLAGGGASGFSLGLPKACELAHRLSGTNAPLPWRE